MRGIFLYLLAYAAQATGVDVLGATAMSTHVHVVIHDREGRHPDFTRILHALLARALNHLRERQGAVFERRSPGVVELADREAQLTHLAYVAANPVASGLVEHGRDWPGARTHAEDVRAGSLDVVRPDTPFFEQSVLPERITLRLAVPPGFSDLGRDAFATLLAKRIASAEEAARSERRRARKGFLGERGLKRQSWRNGPPWPSKLQRRQIRPEVMATEPETRRALLDAIATFRRAYSEALAALRGGLRDALFPEGTWLLAKRFGAQVAPSSA